MNYSLHEIVLLLAVVFFLFSLVNAAIGGSRSLVLVLLLGLIVFFLFGCAKTFLVVRVEEKGYAKLTLEGGTLELVGPADSTFVCRTWGDSYFQVWQATNSLTCSGGQLSDNGVKFGGVVVEGAIKGAALATGIGAAGGAASAAGAAGGVIVERIEKERAAQEPTQ